MSDARIQQLPAHGWPGDWHPVTPGEPIEDWGHRACRVCEAARGETPVQAAERILRESDAG